MAWYSRRRMPVYSAPLCASPAGGSSAESRTSHRPLGLRCWITASGCSDWSGPSWEAAFRKPTQVTAGGGGTQLLIS